MKKNMAVHGLAIVLMAVMIGGCATVPGVFNGLGSDVMSMIIIYRTDDQPLTKQQYDAVGVVAKKMGIQIGWQLSSAFEAAVTSAVADGTVGALGGASQHMYFPSTKIWPVTGYMAGIFALGGVVDGLVTASHANVAAVAAAAENALRDKERYDKRIEFNRVHVVAALIRSRNAEGSPAPGLVKRMPDWNGPRTGSSVQ